MVPEVCAVAMSDACAIGEPRSGAPMPALKSDQKYEPLEAVDICLMVLNVCLFATQVEESSYRGGSEFSRANPSPAEAVVNAPGVVAVPVDPAVAEMAVMTPFGAPEPEPLTNAVCSAYMNASP